MLFTWSTQDLCIVFRWWHISGPASLIFSLLGVVALAAGYEAIRSGSRKYELWVAKREDEVPRMFYPPMIITPIILFLIDLLGFD